MIISLDAEKAFDKIQHTFMIKSWKYKEIHQCNTLYKQTKDKYDMIISLNAEKAFDKIQHTFMIKVLERSGIQGPYLNMIKQSTANQ